MMRVTFFEKDCQRVFFATRLIAENAVAGRWNSSELGGEPSPLSKETRGDRGEGCGFRLTRGVAMGLGGGHDS